MSVDARALDMKRLDVRMTVCGPRDAEQLTQFARSTFLATYSPTHPATALHDYCAREFQLQTVARSLGDPGVWVGIARSQDGTPVGYIWLDREQPPLPTVETGLLHLRRLFVVPEWHGKGVAAALMDRCKREAARRHASGLWLAVWQEARRPIAFYEKCGFGIAGTSIFQMQGHHDRDYIMVNTAL